MVAKDHRGGRAEPTFPYRVRGISTGPRFLQRPGGSTASVCSGRTVEERVKESSSRPKILMNGWLGPGGFFNPTRRCCDVRRGDSRCRQCGHRAHQGFCSTPSNGSSPSAVGLRKALNAKPTSWALNARFSTTLTNSLNTRMWTLSLFVRLPSDMRRRLLRPGRANTS